MTDLRRVGVGLAAWTVIVSAAHIGLNVDWQSAVNDFRPEAERKLNVAYIPVT